MHVSTIYLNDSITQINRKEKRKHKKTLITHLKYEKRVMKRKRSTRITQKKDGGVKQSYNYRSVNRNATEENLNFNYILSFVLGIMTFPYEKKHIKVMTFF